MMRLILILVSLVLLGSVWAQPAPPMKKIHVVFMNHLDVGFDGISPEIGLAINVINRYFDVYFPRAIQAADGFSFFNRTYIYTTHAWLVDLYLNCQSTKAYFPGDIHCPNATMLEAFKQAVNDKVFWWHAFPFNGEPETYDSSLFKSALATAKRVAAQFNKKAPIAMSQRDVPGMTRAVIPILRQAGVEAITVGVNEASSPPAVPTIFLWGDSKSASDSIITIYHPGGYGGIGVKDLMYIPGTDVGLIAAFKTDNAGPPFADEAMQWITVIGQEFPDADIFCSTFDDFVRDILPYRDQLPLVSAEIGDTWIHGVATDPRKSQDFRETMRVRADYCMENRGCPDATTAQSSNVDPAIVAFDRLLMKLGEHTWGLDIKSFLNDTVNWTNKQLQQHLDDPNFQLVIQSWQEQRSYLRAAIIALGPKHPLAERVQQALQALHEPVHIPHDMVTVDDWADATFMAGHYVIRFGSQGSITSLFDFTRRISIVNNPEFGLGHFIYSSLSADTYTHFLNDYSYCNYANGGCSWFGLDFGKPNVSSANPVQKLWNVTVDLFKQGKNNVLNAPYNLYYVQLSMTEKTATSYYGAPKYVGLLYNITADGTINVDVMMHQKTATRLPESTFFSFFPTPQSSSWVIPKLQERIDSSKIVTNGSLHLHVQNGPVTLQLDGGAVFAVDSPDAPLVAVGKPFAIPLPLNKPADQKGGVHFCLHNNIWGTNYPMWYPFVREDAGTLRWRFSFSLQ